MHAVNYLSNKGYHIARDEVQDSYYGIIDAWGIRYRDLYSMGIEVKVSRADWRNAKHKDHKADEMIKDPNLKWSGTNEIYYACPAGLIQPEEISKSHGLLWFKNGRFINKKKPYFLKVGLTRKMQTLLNIYDPFITSYPNRGDK